MKNEIPPAYVFGAWLCLNVSSIAIAIIFGRESDILIMLMFGANVCLFLACVINALLNRRRVAVKREE